MTDIIKGAIQLLRSHNCPFLDPFPIFEKETSPFTAIVVIRWPLSLTYYVKIFHHLIYLIYTNWIFFIIELSANLH